VALEGLAEMLEVIPGGVALDEAARDKHARTVIDSEQQCLLVRCRPPLVDRAVVLPEFADVSAAETPIPVAALVAASTMSMTEWFLPVPTFRTIDPAPCHCSASPTARATSDTCDRATRSSAPRTLT
jgi:hypothetical protein